MAFALFHRCAPSRQDRRYLPWILLACIALLLYAQPHRPEPYAYPLSRIQQLAPLPAPASLSPDSAEAPITSPSLAALTLPRFDKLRSAPILAYEAALALESLRCPATHLQSNRDQLKNEGEHFWPAVTVQELEGARRRVVDRVKSRFGWGAEQEEMLSDDGVEAMLGKGRGLVFAAGNKDTASRLLTSLRILRKHHNCTLPVEIFAFPSELAALGEVKGKIDDLGDVTWRTSKAEVVEGAWKQFGIKGDAIARSSFAEILYLDSDNTPLVDPSFLFDSPTYKEHGIVLWPDFNRDSAANPIWRLLAHSCSPSGAWQAESGQLLVDKRARSGINLVALEVARAMMREEEFWFRLSGGDKDLFRFAFLFLSLPYSMAPHYPSALGGPPLSRPFRGHTSCGHTMLQYGLDSEREWALLRSSGRLPALAPGGKADKHAPPLFVHANVLKHTGYTHRRGTTFVMLKRPVDDRLSAAPDALQGVRQAGLPTHGICVDVWDAEAREGARERVEGAQDGAYEEGGVVLERWEAAWEGLGSGFEEMYYDEGGVAGAW
ncbi:hypothetical protein JCM10449v2_004360 [Rhodotorula kratochvilovae]